MKIRSAVFRGFFIACLFLYHSLSAQNIAINEVMSSNATTIFDEDNSPEDWIEIHNFGSETVNLNGFGLTDDPGNSFKWIFPNVTIAPNEYMLVWASNKNRVVPGQPLHTNFKISSGGEDIVLTHPDGTIINQAPATALIEDVSIGRQPDGTGPWLFFYTATPGMPNTGQGSSELLTPPAFSQESGFFTQAFNLTLSHTNTDAVIIYTLDGSDPDINNLGGTTFQYKNVYPIAVGSAPGPFLTETYKSFQYNEPIAVYDRSQEPDKLASKNSRQHELYVPPTPVRKAMIIKARTYIDGIPSKIAAHTYFMWPNGNPYSIPVLSLQTQETNLFDYDLGTYNAGVDFDTWRANNPSNNQYYRPEWCNYFRKGSAWEYPVNVEIFDNGNSILNINAGYRIHGNNSRTYVIKSLRLYGNSRYGDTDIFEHNLFDSPIFDATNPTNNRYKRILLRPNGGGGSVAYDVVFNRIMAPVYNGLNRVKPAIHFINGEYWGLTAFRDRFDKYHYAYNFNLDKDNVVQVDCEGSNCEIDEGDDSDYTDFINLRNYINQNDMANSSNYTTVASQLDMVSFIDHMVIQVYSGNNGYERKFWKARIPENDTYGDGKWRTSVQDFEATLNTSRDWLVHWGTITESPNESQFTRLLANTTFKNQFITRFADMLNSCFRPSNFENVVNTAFSEVEPYLSENFNRTPAENFYTQNDKSHLLNWGNSHPEAQRNSLLSFFNISGTLDITLKVSDADAGIIKLNTITIDDRTPGIPTNPYPWTGVYFQNIPVTVKAIAQPGYVFTHWSGDISGTDEEITFTPTSTMQVQANFSIDTSVRDLVYFWFMDNRIPNDTPLEFLDATFSSNGLTASLLYDSCLDGYPFDNTHPMWRKASMERRNAPTPLNYFESGNNNDPYNSSAMKGIQIKQPFQDGNLQNTIRMAIPTTDLKQIRVSFAVASDGAADTLIFDYWDGTNWTNAGISNSTTNIEGDYTVVEIDLTDVPAATNNPDFQFRIRFDGDDMTASDGKRVQFNNFAVEGRAYLAVPDHVQRPDIKIYPNPVHSVLHISSTEKISEISVYTMYGQRILQKQANGNQLVLDLSNLATGVYILKAKSGISSSKVFRIIKQ